METVLKSTNNRQCRPKVDVFYSIRAWDIGGETIPSMKILGHGNGSKIHKPSDLSTQSWCLLQHTCMVHRRWKQDLVWKLWVMKTVLKSTNPWRLKQDLVWNLWVMGTVQKSTNHRPCRPKENFGSWKRYLNPQTIASVDPKLTFFTAYVHGT